MQMRDSRFFTETACIPSSLLKAAISPERSYRYTDQHQADGHRNLADCGIRSVSLSFFSWCSYEMCVFEEKRIVFSIFLDMQVKNAIIPSRQS